VWVSIIATMVVVVVVVVFAGPVLATPPRRAPLQSVALLDVGRRRGDAQSEPKPADSKRRLVLCPLLRVAVVDAFIPCWRQI
jgi:hypothetical protein